MEELETREETVRVIREGDPDADHESVTIEKTKTIRKTVDRPKKPSGKRTGEVSAGRGPAYIIVVSEHLLPTPIDPSI